MKQFYIILYEFVKSSLNTHGGHSLTVRTRRGIGSHNWSKCTRTGKCAEIYLQYMIVRRAVNFYSFRRRLTNSKFYRNNVIRLSLSANSSQVRHITDVILLLWSRGVSRSSALLVISVIRPLTILLSLRHTHVRLQQ